MAAVAAHAEDAGSAAYYTAHPTWDPPSPLAFAALGQRDVSPTLLRVRALALEGQIYESETGNPELALPGRFDFAFVAVYLAPLVLIALLHDLWSGEREAGRAALLGAAPRARWRLWAPRIGVRAGLVLLALLLPFFAGAVISGADPGRTLLFAGAVAGLMSFWTAVSVAVARYGARSAVNAAALAGVWFALTLIVPAGGNLLINAAVPIPAGADLARANRDAVHGAWDQPQQQTLDRFLALHPEWVGTAPLSTPFHWKWYFAFQHLGDVQVAEQSAEYRQGIERREALAGALGWMASPVGFQRALHRLAETDVTAQLAYQDRVRAFHDRLRAFYYPYLFRDLPFERDDFERAPRFGVTDESSPLDRA